MTDARSEALLVLDAIGVPPPPPNAIFFAIEGKPVAKQSFRARIFNGKIFGYKDKRVKDYEEMVAELFLDQHSGREPFVGGVGMLIISEKSSGSKKGLILPDIKRPDTEQIEKPIKDALQMAGIYQDDAAVWDARVIKVVTGRKRVCVFLWATSQPRSDHPA